MASLALGAVGSYIGGPIGYAIGSAIGSMLDPQKLPTQYGQRITDNKITTATYGNCLPVIYKTMRTAGNMIASTPLQETTNRETQGGKGGPSQAVVTYTYSQTMAIAICEGPITGIRKIWANGELIYNSGSTNSSTVLASRQIAEDITFYNGSEDQMPDPTIQSFAGIDKTSAYRGTAYVVFNNFQLAKYGNRTPNFEFEVVNNGTTSYIANELYSLPTPFTTSPFAEFSRIFYANFPTINATKQSIYVVGVLAGEVFERKNFKIARYEIFTNGKSALKGFKLQNILPIPDGATDVFGLSDAKSDDDSTVIVTNLNTRTYYCLFNDGSLTNLNLLSNMDYGADTTFVSVKNKDNIFLSCDATHDKTITRIKCSGQTFREPKTINIPFYTKRMELTENFLYVLDVNNVIKKYDFDLNLLDTIFTLTIGVLSTITSGDSDELYMIYKNTNNISVPYNIVEISTKVQKVITVLPSNATITPYFFFKSGLFYFINNSPVGSFASTVISETIVDSDVTLAEVVSDIVTKSSLKTTDIDVSDLANIKIEGYQIGSRMSLRNALEPLMQAYFFDNVESSGKLKFVKRGKTNFTFIPEDDLAASTYGSALPDQLNSLRKESLELPNEITLEYSDIDFDYQVGTQYSRRLIVDTVNANTLQLAMAFNKNKAKQICDIMLYSAWQERTALSFKISNKYLYLDPTDIVKIVKDGNEYFIRLTDSDYQNNILSYNGVEEDVTIYSQNAVGASLPAVKQEISLMTPTNLMLLDIPIVRDQDDKVGYYVAGSGYASGWPGCQVYKSIDDGASFTPFGDIIKREAIVGNTTTVLGNFRTGNIFDELNSVVVTTNQSLQSISEMAVLNGGNLALIGNELIQFKTATLIATNRYRLSGMLRGKFGTERAMNSHSVGERFVIMTPDNIYIETSQSSEYGLEREYAGVTFGQMISDANVISFTNTAVAQRPYSPVQVAGGRDTTGNAYLKWVRRTRISGGWNNYTDVPVGETDLMYSIDILKSDGSVARTIDVNTNNLIYTTAQQIADFGSVQNSITYNVYQISSLVGRGYAGRVTF